MAEEETKEEPKEEIKEEPKSTALIDKAQEAAERLEKANEEQAKLLAKQEEILARQALGGRSEAGVGDPEKKKETEEDYAKRVISGEANPLADDGFI